MAALLSECTGNAGCQTRDTKPEVDTTTIGATLVPLVTVLISGLLSGDCEHNSIPKYRSYPVTWLASLLLVVATGML